MEPRLNASHNRTQNWYALVERFGHIIVFEPLTMGRRPHTRRKMANDCINPNIDSDLIGNVDVTEFEWREAIIPSSFFYDRGNKSRVPQVAGCRPFMVLLCG
jgi:hypothetical protein